MELIFFLTCMFILNMLTLLLNLMFLSSNNPSAIIFLHISLIVRSWCLFLSFRLFNGCLIYLFASLHVFQTKTLGDSVSSASLLIGVSWEPGLLSAPPPPPPLLPCLWLIASAPCSLFTCRTVDWDSRSFSLNFNLLTRSLMTWTELLPVS